jgi:chemotaxis protein methyltransferase CheR
MNLTERIAARAAAAATGAPAPASARATEPSFQATLKTDDFVVLCELVRRLCAVDLLQYKRGQMERRVRTFAQRRGSTDLAEYGARLKADREELDAFLDRVTINVSHLWRHEDQWSSLGDTILPELAERGQVRCWSAGCSYGAEAFTLGAVAREAVPAARVEIHGTDLDRRMVARARAGLFSAEDARTAPPALLKRWFDPVDDGGWQAKPDLMRMMRFDVGDLLRMPVESGRYDLIMCRNTVIYFTEEVRDALHGRLADALAPGGYLIVGTSERVANPRTLGLTSPFHFIYRKSQP